MRPFRVTLQQVTAPRVHTLEYVSPTALETFDEKLGGCARKWAWVKIDRLPRPQSKAAWVGDRMHAHHEKYLRFGTPYDQTEYEGRLAAASQHLLPEPNPALYEVEKEVRIKIAGYWFGGRIDLRWKEPFENGFKSVVYDHKSTGDLRWAKLEKAQLLAHPQAPIYALATMKDHGTLVADIRWNYAVKDSRPKAVPSWHTITDLEAYEGVAPYLETAANMYEIVRLANTRGLRAINLPFNPAACDAYGGCPFRERCNLTRKEVLDVMTNPKPLSFLERLKAGNPQIDTPNVAPVPNVAPIAPVAQVAQHTSPAIPPPPPMSLPIPGPIPAPPPMALPPIVNASPVLHYGNAINPPESALPVAAAPVAPVVPAVVQAATPTEPAPEASKKGRGRPKGSKNKVTVEASAPVVETAEEPVTVVEKPVSDSDEKYEAIRAACIIASGYATNSNLSADQVARLSLQTYAAIHAAVHS